MKMILTTFIVCMITSISYTAKAQESMPVRESKKVYLRIGGGYTFQSGKTEFNNADPNGLTGIVQSTDVLVSSDGSSTDIKSLNGTVGAGIKGILAVGYMFNSFIGAEIAIDYFHGDKTMIGRLRSPQANSEETVLLRGLDLKPAILLTPNLKFVNPYARIGVLVPVAGDLTINTTAKSINGGGAGTDILVNAKSKVKSDFSIGFFGALGVNFPVNNALSIFGEVEIKNLSVKSKSAKITEYVTKASTDGQSQLVPGQQLSDLPLYKKQFDFSNHYSESNTTEPNQDSPRKIPLQYVNVSGTGINLGIRFTL